MPALLIIIGIYLLGHSVLAGWAAITLGVFAGVLTWLGKIVKGIAEVIK